MSIIGYLLACYGVCFCLINKAVFLRRVGVLDRMLDCSYCTGFHAGWITYFLMVGADGFISSLTIASAFASAAFCYIIDTAVLLIEEQTAHLKHQSKPNHHPNLFG